MLPARALTACAAGQAALETVFDEGAQERALVFSCARLLEAAYACEAASGERLPEGHSCLRLSRKLQLRIARMRAEDERRVSTAEAAAAAAPQRAASGPAPSEPELPQQQQQMQTQQQTQTQTQQLMQTQHQEGEGGRAAAAGSAPAPALLQPRLAQRATVAVPTAAYLRAAPQRTAMGAARSRSPPMQRPRDPQLQLQMQQQHTAMGAARSRSPPVQRTRDPSPPAPRLVAAVVPAAPAPRHASPPLFAPQPRAMSNPRAASDGRAMSNPRAAALGSRHPSPPSRYPTPPGGRHPSPPARGAFDLVSTDPLSQKRARAATLRP